MDSTETKQASNKFLIGAIIASQFAPPFMFSGVAVALPSLSADLGASAVSLGLVETLFLTSQLSFLLPVGRLADAGDKRAMYKYAFFGFWLACLAIALSSTMWFILALRFVQGICSAVFAGTGPAILAELVPAEKRGKIYGYSIGAVYAGLAAGPICAGVLVEHFGWRSLFFSGAGLLLVGHIMMLFMMKSKWKTPPANTVHLPSALMIVISVLAMVVGTSFITKGFWGYICIALSFGMAIFFVLLQNRLEKPLLNIKNLMSNLVLRSALLVQVLLYMNAFSTIFMLSIYMQISLGHSANMTGKILATGTLLMVLVAPFAGRISDKYKPQKVALVGIFSILVSSSMALFLNAGTSLGFIIPMLVLNGMGFALFSSPNMAIIMGSVPANLYGIVSALGAKARSLGMMAGMLVTTLLISLHIGDDPVSVHAQEFIAIMHKAFLVLLSGTVLALLVSYKGRKT